MRRLVFALMFCSSPALAEPTGVGGVEPYLDTPIAVNAKTCRRCRPASRPQQVTQGRSSDLIAIAFRYLGSRNPTSQRGPWCGHFLNMVLREAGYSPMPSGLATDAAKLGPRLPAPVAGAVIFRPGHVEISLGDGRSISGNWHNRVAIHASSRGVVVQPRRG